jgi:hypothetical protein
MPSVQWTTDDGQSGEWKIQDEWQDGNSDAASETLAGVGLEKDTGDLGAVVEQLFEAAVPAEQR